MTWTNMTIVGIIVTAGARLSSEQKFDLGMTPTPFAAIVSYRPTTGPFLAQVRVHADFAKKNFPGVQSIQEHSGIRLQQYHTPSQQLSFVPIQFTLRE